MLYHSSFQSRLFGFGYQFLGPFLVDWYNRLSDATKDQGTNVVYMFGREGWNLVPLFNTIETLRKTPRSRFVFLQTSRALLTHISLSHPEHAMIGFSLSFSGTVRQFFEDRLGLPFELLELPAVDSQHVELPRDREFLLLMFAKNRSAAEQFAARSHTAYGEYLARLGFAEGRVHPVSDLGFRGTTQALISALYGYALVGFYAMLDPAGVPGLPLPPGSAHGLFSDSKSFGQNFAPLDRSLLFEAFLTAPFGQVSGIQAVAAGDPFLYRAGGPGQRNFAMIAGCMQGVHKFALDHADLLGGCEPLIADFEEFFEAFQDAISSEIKEFRKVLVLDDSFNGRELNNAEAKL